MTTLSLRRLQTLLIAPVAMLALTASLGATPDAVTNSGATPPARVLTANIPAAALTHLDLTALDGRVDLAASADPAANTITVTVSLDAPRLKNFKRPPAADLSTVALKTTVAANVLRLALENAREGNIEASWTIVVPARFSARIDGHDGQITVTGLEGGIEASLNAGLGGRRAQLIVDVPRGALQLSVAVGDITARRRSATFDRAEVNATVGNAELYLMGHEIKSPRAPGPGHRVELDGDGPEAIRARVTVGDVSVRIG
jgi:hypothetical protein